MGLGDPTRSSTQQIDLVKETMEQEIHHCKKRVTEEDTMTWDKEMREAKRTINMTDPDLVRLDLEQVRKRAGKYQHKSMGNPRTEFQRVTNDSCQRRPMEYCLTSPEK
jgi:hypothetical protein